MENFLQETKEALEHYGKTIDDIKWIGSKDGYIDIEEFFRNADFEYDSGYGAAHIAQDLVIVGEDWWLERGEYDGSEWWQYKSFPIKPTKQILNPVLGLGMWDSLAVLSEFNPDNDD